MDNINTYTMIDSNEIMTNLSKGNNVYTVGLYKTPIQYINKQGILLTNGDLIPHSKINDFMWFIDNDTTITIQ